VLEDGTGWLSEGSAIAGISEDLAVLLAPHLARQRTSSSKSDRGGQHAVAVKLDVGCGSEKRRAIASL
jgi:hypothetical protein